MLGNQKEFLGYPHIAPKETINMYFCKGIKCIESQNVIFNANARNSMRSENSRGHALQQPLLRQLERVLGLSNVAENIK